MAECSASASQWTSFCEDLAISTARSFALRFAAVSPSLCGFKPDAVDDTLGLLLRDDGVMGAMFLHCSELFLTHLNTELECQREALAAREEERENLMLDTAPIRCGAGGDRSGATPIFAPTITPTSPQYRRRETTHTKPSSPSWLQTGSAYIREKISTPRKSSLTHGCNSKLPESGHAATVAATPAAKSAKVIVDVRKEGVLKYRSSLGDWVKVRLSSVDSAAGGLVEWRAPPSAKRALDGLFACHIKEVLDISDAAEPVFKIKTSRAEHLFAADASADAAAWVEELLEMRRRRRRSSDCCGEGDDDDIQAEWDRNWPEEELYGLFEYPWYHGALSRDEAARDVVPPGKALPSGHANGHHNGYGNGQFNEQYNGLFLVRRSSNSKEEYNYVLTFNYQGRAKHLRLGFRPEDGQCRLLLPKAEWRSSIFDLLEHYRLYSLPLESLDSEEPDAVLRSFVVRQRSGKSPLMSAMVAAAATGAKKATRCALCGGGSGGSGGSFRSRVGSEASQKGWHPGAETIEETAPDFDAASVSSGVGSLKRGAAAELWTHGGSVRRRLNSLEKQRLLLQKQDSRWGSNSAGGGSSSGAPTVAAAVHFP